jgi:hypothetical protein
LVCQIRCYMVLFLFIAIHRIYNACCGLHMCAIRLNALAIDISTCCVQGAELMAPRWHQKKQKQGLSKGINNRFWKIPKSKSLFLGQFRGPGGGGMGICGNHWKWSQFRECKIWWKSVRKTSVSWPYYFFDVFEKVIFGLSALRAPTVGPWSSSVHAWLLNCQAVWPST